MTGKHNIVIGLLALSFYMMAGLILIYFYDVSLHENLYIQGYQDSKSSQVALMVGFMFPVLNIITGLILVRFPFSEKAKRFISTVAFFGLLTPLGILMKGGNEYYPILIVIGVIAMVFSMTYFALQLLKIPEYSFGKAGDVR